MRKRNLKIHECQTAGRKVLCGKFAQRMKGNYAVGDQDNNLLLYNSLSAKPITLMNSQVSNVSSLTALTFANDDSHIIAGSNRGSINSWDIQSSKVSFCLKGHTIQVSTLYTNKRNSNLIISGSMDTNTKIWDLRTKNAIHTLKNHHKKVTAISMTPDSKVVISGSDDGIVQTWQVRMQKTIFQYQLATPILSLDSNDSNLMAVGSLDRVARIFQVNAPFSVMGQTKNQTMPISKCIFYKQKFLFTAGTDNLKVWDVEQDVVMVDNIETSSKGILGMTIDDRVQQIAYSGGVLSYHETLLTSVSFKGQRQIPTIRYQPRELPDDSPMRTSKNFSTVKRGQSMIRPIQSLISNQKTKQLFARRNDSLRNTLAKQLSGVNTQISDVLANIKKVSNQFESKRKQLSQLQELMGNEHAKFMRIIAARAKSMHTILDAWNKGNSKFLVQHLRTIDIYVASDALTQILTPTRYQVSVQFACVIALRSKQMILSKHITLIKNGLSHLLKVVSLFKEQMINLKVFGCDKGVDLAREERLKRFDQLIQQYIEVSQSQRIKKIIEKRDQTSTLAQQLQNQLKLILNKVYGENLDQK